METDNIDYEALLSLALKAAESAYAPYSKYCVGAAILTEGGQIFTGSNVENSYIGCTICAERTAAVKAVSAGARRFRACAIVCLTDDGGMPCGICRQVLSEFNRELIMVVRKGRDGYFTIPLSELLPDIEPRPVSAYG